jgi:hypothetical protein
MTNRTVRFVVCSALGVAFVALAGSGSAFAQDNPPAEGAAASAPPAAGGEATPAVAATPPPAAAAPAGPANVTLRQGGIGIDGDVAVGLAKGAAGKPISIVPNVYYGVSDALSVGLASNHGSEVFQTAGVGQGLCLSGQSNGCGKVYNNVSLDGLFSFSRSAMMDVAAHGGLDTQFGDSTLLSVRVGVKGRLLSGPLVLTFDPSLNIGANKREEALNKEVLAIPLRVGFLATPQLNVGLSVAFVTLIDPPSGIGIGDIYQVPVGIGGAFAINNMLSVRAQFTLNQLLSASNSLGGAGRADNRALSIGAAYTM